MFGLTDVSVRLNGIDAIYGGAGHRIGLMEPGDLAANGHARDADAILGDNGNLYRIVGAFGSPFVDALGGFKPAPPLAFVYDNYSSERIVPRAWSLLDYSWARERTNRPGPGRPGARRGGRRPHHRRDR